VGKAAGLSAPIEAMAQIVLLIFVFFMAKLGKKDKKA
jgi:hypothetical protein